MLHIAVVSSRFPTAVRSGFIPRRTRSSGRECRPSPTFTTCTAWKRRSASRIEHGARITVITMGPPPAEKTLKECISLGADEAILVTDRKFAGGGYPGYLLCAGQGHPKGGGGIRPRRPGVLRETDPRRRYRTGGTGNCLPVGSEQLTYVEKVVRLDVEKRRITVHRHLEDGVEVVETRLPALITALQEMNKVRRASLPGMIRAARYKPIVWTVKDFSDIDVSKIGLKGSPTIVAKSWVPEQKPVDGEILEDTPPEEAARQLVDKLWETELPEKLGWDAEREEVAP